MTTPAGDTEQYERDGVTYELTAEAADGGYYGKWQCHACGKGGRSNLRDSTIAHALLSARMSADAHHLLRHTPATGNP